MLQKQNSPTVETMYSVSKPYHFTCILINEKYPKKINEILLAWDITKDYGTRIGQRQPGT